MLFTATTANNINTNGQTDASERLSSCPNSRTYSNDKHVSRPRCHSSPNFNAKSNNSAKSQQNKIIEYHHEGSIYELDANKANCQKDTLERLSSCPSSKTYVERPRCHSSPEFDRTNSGIVLPEKVIVDEFAEENICDMDEAALLSFKPYGHYSQNVHSALDFESKDSHYNRYRVDDAWNGIMQNHNEESVNFPEDVKLESNAELDFFVNQRDINENLTRSSCSKRQNYNDSDFNYSHEVVHSEKSNKMDFNYSDEVGFNEKSNEMMKYIYSDVSKLNYQLKEDNDKYERCTKLDADEDGSGVFDKFSSVDLKCRNKYETSSFNFRPRDSVDAYQQSNHSYAAREKDFNTFSSDDFINFDINFNRNNRSLKSQKKKSIKYDGSKEAAWQYTAGLDHELDGPRCRVDLPACRNELKYQSLCHNEFSSCFDSAKKVGRNKDNLNTWEQISYNYGSSITHIINTPKVKYKQDASILSAVKKFSNI